MGPIYGSHTNRYWNNSAASRPCPLFMSITANFVLIVFTQCIWDARAVNPMIGVLADLQLGFPETDQVAAAAFMACRHIQIRDSRLVDSALSSDFNVSCNFVDHSWRSKTEVAEAALHWSTLGADFMVGAYTSEASGPLAVIGGLYEIPVVGFWSASDTLSDKQVYQYYGRTNPAALAVPRAIMKFVAAMGWTNFGYIYADDANGNSNNNAFQKFSREEGLHVLTSQQFNAGDPESIRYAVKGLAASGCRIFVTGASLVDMVVIIEAADEEGIIGAGYTWFGSIGNPVTFLAMTTNATRSLELVSGWMFIRSDPFAEEAQWQRFDDVWKSETFQNVQIADVDLVVHRPMPPTVNAVDCFSVCGYIYDAVWTAALAMDRSVKADSGAIVPAAVLAAWRDLEFEGATGRVRFDDRLDRGPGVPLVLVNWVPVQASDGTWSITLTDIASWEGGTDVLKRYEFDDDSAPAWAGGGRGWDAVPGGQRQLHAAVYGHLRTVLIRGLMWNQVLFLASLKCEPCPAGSFQNGTECLLCPPGFHAPEPAMLQCLPCLQSGYAPRAGMAECLACAAHYEMPSHAYASTSDQDCVCRSGYTAGCSWHVWQVLVVVMAAVVALKLVHSAWHCSRRAQEEEEEALEQRISLLRRLLRLGREHGFRFRTEPRSWAQWLGLSPHRLIRARPLKHLAMLTLIRRFDVGAVDSLSVLFQALAEQLDAESGGEGGSSYAGSSSAGTRKGNLILNHRQLTLCNIVILVSCQLLDPGILDNAGVPAIPASSKPRLRGATGAVSTEILLVAVPETYSSEERFLFFRDLIAHLDLWEHGDAFAALKAQLQLSLDALRTEMDTLYAELVAEEGGRALVAWAPAVAHYEDETGPVQRQDHARVMAVRFDEHARKQMEVVKEAGGGKVLHYSSPSRSHSGGSPILVPPSFAPSRASSCGDGPGRDGESEPRVWAEGEVEKQFVAQLHLQSCLLDESFQQTVRASMDARAVELQLLGGEDDAQSEAHSDAAHSPAHAHTPARLQVSAGAIKTVKRMLEKVKTYGEEARGGKTELSEPFTGHVLDPVRACVICPNPKELLETAKWMLENGSKCGLPVVRVKNKFSIKDSSEYDGYRDLMLSVLHTGARGLRIVGELQFHDQRMYALKVHMHRLYKVKRAQTAASI